MVGLSGDEGKVMVIIYKFLRRENGSEGDELFSVVYRSNRMRFVEGNFRLNIREILFFEIDIFLIMEWNFKRVKSKVRCGLDKL